ncbi:MAG: hypothetical protein UU54_C0002G0019 [Candidatus Yanofskybacteria bacterium GW2011_GWA2_41_22]|uniref:Uncharacterized protein n=2 Tax=Candidatus Yanofskyibacteriota TaxID=1752733 RepID=A0A0G0XX41_9BACT|nr:MAG: hypothetical protein UU54_C0002G0019 [Candidatus Yanofskybacteria bacterium GW2011_GWA2_41_22]OGM99072.1 MAG: hypothetical protein A2736_02005 [Candidatus Yanofskybacteria bacterium RIFCSPHIGHO2_01_FULL_41_27]
MTRQNKISFIILFVGLGFLSFVVIQKALADVSNIKFPVAELGGCTSETECRSYCDKPENAPACLDFAEKNNLMEKGELETARKFVASGNKGPGGCTGKDSCETFCNDISHIEECVSFAEQNGLMPEKELKEARQVRDAIKRGIKPPACTSKKACDSYCEAPEHMEECISFAIEAGFMPEAEKENAQKMLSAIKRGVKPPPCRGKEACDQYCQSPDNMEVCMNFAVEAGFMPEAEKENAQKMLSAIKKGIKPPNCKGKEECDSYCQSDEHFEECANFAEAAGFMDAKEAEMARKTKGKGPGGCKGKEECEAFCNNQDNQEICFKFAEDNGMIPEEQIKEMREGTARMREGLNNAPPEVRDCLNSTLGSDAVNKIQSGELTPGPQIGDSMRQCFEKARPNMESPGMMPKPGEEQRMENGMPSIEGGEFRPGPGGCSTPEECQNYCSQNPEACSGGRGPENGQRPFGSPGEFEPQEPREGELPLGEEFKRRPFPSGQEGQEPPFQGEMKPGERMLREFPREGMPPTEGQPPQEFKLPGESGGESIPNEQFRQAEPMPQTEQQPQMEIAPPPPPPAESAPAPEPPPSSFLNNQYLGAIARFLFGL